MIEIFKTSILQQQEAFAVIKTLSDYLPSLKINFDLSDCDKILRVEGQHFCAQTIIEILKGQGHYCQVLEG